MEPQCDYFMYFPSAPLSSLSDPAEYKTLPRRKHVYLGETIQFLFVLRSRNAAQRDSGSAAPPRVEPLGSLHAQARVCLAEGQQLQRGCDEDGWGEEPRKEATDSTDTCGSGPHSGHAFKGCCPLRTHCSGGEGRQQGGEPVKSALMLDDQVIFCLTVSLDKLPVNTLKAKVIVTVWREEEEENAELKEHGYLTLMQLRSPTHTFRQERSTFKAQVSTVLNVLPPPSVQCQQMTISGKHLTVLKVLNCSSQEVCVRDMKIIPNYNSAYLPIMPDGSVLIVDNVCHQSAEITVASFCRIDSQASRLPSILSALEEQNFMFQLQLQETIEEDSSEGLEVPLVAVVQWYTPTLPSTRYIFSFYSLPSVRLARPQLLMTASCASAVRPLERFWVKYTLQNSLQDFLSVRLIWESEAHRGSEQDPVVRAVVCQSPFSHLGQCRKGSTLSFAVAFQILRTGLFELSKQMKLRLQFRAPVSPPPMESRSPLRNPPPPSSSSSSDPWSRDLLGRHSLGQSQSFSHQPPPMSHHIRSGSMISPPVGCLPPTYSTVSLDKIAKRECKVLVLEPVPEAQGR